MRGVRKEEEPFDRLTNLCKVMTDALDDAVDEERETPMGAKLSDVRGIVFLSDDNRAGIQMHGYEDMVEGLAELFVHLKAMFTSMGKDFGVMTDLGILMLDDDSMVSLPDEESGRE
jgi:hypothetical protein